MIILSINNHFSLLILIINWNIITSHNERINNIQKNDGDHEQKQKNAKEHWKKNYIRAKGETSINVIVLAR